MGHTFETTDGEILNGSGYEYEDVTSLNTGDYIYLYDGRQTDKYQIVSKTLIRSSCFIIEVEKQ